MIVRPLMSHQPAIFIRKSNLLANCVLMHQCPAVWVVQPLVRRCLASRPASGLRRPWWPTTGRGRPWDRGGVGRGVARWAPPRGVCEGWGWGRPREGDSKEGACACARAFGWLRALPPPHHAPHWGGVGLACAVRPSLGRRCAVGWWRCGGMQVVGDCGDEECRGCGCGLTTIGIARWLARGLGAARRHRPSRRARALACGVATRVCVRRAGPPAAYGREMADIYATCAARRSGRAFVRRCAR